MAEPTASQYAVFPVEGLTRRSPGSRLPTLGETRAASDGSIERTGNVSTTGSECCVAYDQTYTFSGVEISAYEDSEEIVPLRNASC